MSLFLGVFGLMLAGDAQADRLEELLSRAYDGDSHAMYQLSLALQDRATTSSEPSAQHLADAFGWVYIAARNGHRRAMLAVGRHYLNSEHPAQTAHKAEIWFKRALQAGMSEANYELARLYGTDDLPTFDQMAADLFFQKALAAQDPRACLSQAKTALLPEQNARFHYSDRQARTLITYLECAAQPGEEYSPDAELLIRLSELYDGLGTLDGDINAQLWRQAAHQLSLLSSAQHSDGSD